MAHRQLTGSCCRTQSREDGDAVWMRRMQFQTLRHQAGRARGWSLRTRLWLPWRCRLEEGPLWLRWPHTPLPQQASAPSLITFTHLTHTLHTPLTRISHIRYTLHPSPSHILLRHTSHTLCTPDTQHAESHTAPALTLHHFAAGCRHQTRGALAAPPAGIPGFKKDPEPSPDHLTVEPGVRTAEVGLLPGGYSSRCQCLNSWAGSFPRTGLVDFGHCCLCNASMQKALDRCLVECMPCVTQDISGGQASP